eukprot:222990_1
MERGSLNENIKLHKGCNRFRKNPSERNVLIFGIAMFLVFAAFNTSQNFATSGNARVGSISLGILYGVNAVSCLIAPNIIGHWISIKTSLFIGGVTYALFVSSYIHLIDIILYVSSGILGIGSAFLWIAEGSFVTSCANEFEYEYLLPFNSELGYFNGMFWFIFQFNQFLGNLLAALLFQFDVAHQTIFSILTAVCFIGCIGFMFLQTFAKGIKYFDEEQIAHFAKSIRATHSESIQKKDSNINTENEIMNHYDDEYDQLAWDKSSAYRPHHDILQQLLKENMEPFDVNNNNNDNHSSVLLFHEYHRTEQSKKTVDLMLTIKMWFTSNFLILWLITIYSGVTQGFQFGEFGALIEKDSYKFYALASFGLWDAIFSNLFGQISDKIGRLPILACAIIAHGSVYAFLYFYYDKIPQDLDGLWIWLVCGGMLGMGDAGFNTQLYAFYPILLGDRPETFANFNLWQSASSCWCFFWHSYVSFKVKTLTYGAVMICSAIPIFLTSKGREAARSKKFGNHGH